MRGLNSPPPATAAALPLAVEVGRGGWFAEAIEGREVPGVEVGAPSRRVDLLPDCLAEHHEGEVVDPGGRSWTLVGHHLSS